MKGLILALFLGTALTGRTSDTLSVEAVYEYILICNIKEPEYVLAQSCLETAWYKSYNCKERNNLFGFRSSSWKTERNKHGYKVFHSWKESVRYYKSWQERKKYRNGEVYTSFLKRVGYAEDPEYGSKLNSVLRRLKRVFEI